MNQGASENAAVEKYMERIKSVPSTQVTVASNSLNEIANTLTLHTSQEASEFIRQASRVNVYGITRQVVSGELELQAIGPSIKKLVEGGMSEADAELDIVASMCMIIEDFQMFINVPDANRLSRQAIVDVCHFIIDKMPMISVFEFAHVLSNAKAGQYGPLYNSVDGMKICSFIKEYIDEKTKYIIIEHEEQHKRNKLKGLA